MIQGYPEPHATHLGKTPKQNTFGALVVDGTQHLWTGTTVEDTSALGYSGNPAEVLPAMVLTESGVVI